MRAKIFFSIILLSILGTSCKGKQEETTTPTAEKPAKAIKENFSVEMDLAASKKDDFALYYTEDSTINFTSEMTVWHGVTGDNKRETIVFNLSEELLPTDIRLDFGMNKEQESVTVYNLKISYYGNDYLIKGSDFFKYFIDNKSFKTEINATDGTLKILKVGSEYKTPFFYPRQEIVDVIKKLTSQ
ncbi:hypothetical protein [Flavobacterium sp. XGLA_31]|uniref:hypothetical protein n=1 Tax=Flavobacterium sp. XGLA_31 TaxID=3447666 RepID=UPI003F3F80FC